MSTAAELISRVGKTLFDEAGVRWDEAELLEYLTDAQREICALKPAAYTVNASVQLSSGWVQSLPADGRLLIDVVANMGDDGATPGNAVTEIDRTALDACRPGWRTMTPEGTAKHYIYDDRDPTTFYVYPPQPATAEYVQLSYAAIPPVVAATGDELSLDETYDTAIYYLTLARCFSKSTSTQDFGKAASYQQLGGSIVMGGKIAKQELHPEQQQERVRK